MRSKIYFFTMMVLASATPQQAVASSSFCAVIERTNDGFVNLREGPRVDYNSLGIAIQSDILLVDTAPCRSDFGPLICDETGKWNFVENVIRVGDQSKHFLKGWVNSSFIRQVTCPNSPPASAFNGARCRVMDPTGTPLNARTGPHGTVLGKLSNGILVSIIDKMNDERERSWVYIANYETRLPIGWVYREYIACF
jgi:hypothetical protein